MSWTLRTHLSVDHMHAASRKNHCGFRLLHWRASWRKLQQGSPSLKSSSGQLLIYVCYQGMRASIQHAPSSATHSARCKLYIRLYRTYRQGQADSPAKCALHTAPYAGAQHVHKEVINHPKTRNNKQTTTVRHCLAR